MQSMRNTTNAGNTRKKTSYSTRSLSMFKTLGLFVAGLLLIFSSSTLFATPAVLYDANGQFVGLVENGKQNVIYLSTGEPVAYIDDTNGAVYGYDGRFLGWFSEGIVWDQNGQMVAFLEASELSKTVQINRVVNPAVTVKQIPTTHVQPQTVMIKRPAFVHEFSKTPFTTIYVAK